MPVIAGRSRNPIVQAAFAGLSKAERAQKKQEQPEPANQNPIKKPKPNVRVKP